MDSAPVAAAGHVFILEFQSFAVPRKEPLSVLDAKYAGSCGRWLYRQGYRSWIVGE